MELFITFEGRNGKFTWDEDQKAREAWDTAMLMFGKKRDLTPAKTDLNDSHGLMKQPIYHRKTQTNVHYYYANQF